jgi:hypothetical protein
MVTFVRGAPAGVEVAGNLVMLNVVSSAAPFAQDATRTRGVYAAGRGWAKGRLLILSERPAKGIRNLSANEMA